MHHPHNLVVAGDASKARILAGGQPTMCIASCKKYLEFRQKTFKLVNSETDTNRSRENL